MASWAQPSFTAAATDRARQDTSFNQWNGFDLQLPLLRRRELWSSRNWPTCQFLILLFAPIDGSSPGTQELGQPWDNVHPEYGVRSSHEGATEMWQRIRYDYDQPTSPNESEGSAPVPDWNPEARDLTRIGCLIEAAALLLVSLIFAISQAISGGEW